jgi:hypothetical protein
MYVWQVGDLNRVSFITEASPASENECIVTYKVPNIHESPFIMHHKMLLLLEKVPVELHAELISIVWEKHYEGKRYVLDVLLNIDKESISFIINYLRVKSERDIIRNLNQFVLLKKKS